MKAQPRKPSVPAKSPKTAAKAAKPAAKKTAAKKTVAKAPARAAAKKTVAKPVSKPVKKAPAPAKKAAPAKAKPAAKPAAKVPAKTPAKAPVKAPAKVSRPAAPAATPVKPVSKPAAKAAAKPAAKPAAPAPAAAAPARAPAPVAAPPAVKSTRASRVASFNPPPPAPVVASTAAKASYANTMSDPVLTPPPHEAVKKDPKLANNWKSKTADQLTDAEVLAMPDSEYMNDKQMAFFRLKLAQLKQDILNSAGETTEHLREDTVIVPDPADRATIEEEHALELRTRDRERKLLKKIEQSIARIDAGDYGYCDETGEPIGVGRLLARPTATLSLEAQQRRELKQKMFGD